MATNQVGSKFLNEFTVARINPDHVHFCLLFTIGFFQNLIAIGRTFILYSAWTQTTRLQGSWLDYRIEHKYQENSKFVEQRRASRCRVKLNELARDNAYARCE